MTKKQRQIIFEKSGGRCWYCGCELVGRWHADHFEPLGRVYDLVRINGKYRWVRTGEVKNPDADNIDNLVPSCPPCNIEKGIASIEEFRSRLKDKLGLLMNETKYRTAKRFGLIQENLEVVFYFEQCSNQITKYPTPPNSPT